MWWLLWILLLILLFAIFYILVAPFYFEVNSTTGLFRFRFQKLAYAQIVMHDDRLFLRYKIIWIHREIDLLNMALNRAQPKNTSSHKKKSSIKIKRIPQRLMAVVKSFSIQECYVSVDTGNYPLNGLLFPLFYSGSVYTGKIIKINFWNENEIIFKIKNSIARMSWAFIRIK